MSYTLPPQKLGQHMTTRFSKTNLAFSLCSYLLVQLCKQICLILQSKCIEKGFKLFTIHDGIYTMLRYTYSVICHAALRQQQCVNKMTAGSCGVQSASVYINSQRAGLPVESCRFVSALSDLQSLPMSCAEQTCSFASPVCNDTCNVAHALTSCNHA